MIITNNETFYPTPNELADTMMSMLGSKDLAKIKDILEPSAGDGRLVDALISRCHTFDNDYVRVDCIEIDDTLRATLQGKGYRIIANDFLLFNSKKHYDLILMNPPFNKGAEHLLKAINLAVNNGGGTKVICLLNAETLRNTYSGTRKMLSNLLSKYNAKVKFESQPFSNAERKTNVDVATVFIDIPITTFTSFIMEELDKAEEVSGEVIEPTEIVTDDAIAQSVAFYNKEVELVSKFLKEYFAIKPYINRKYLNEEDSEFLKKMSSEPIINISTGEYSNRKTIESYSDINKVLKKIRYKYWEHLFHNKEFTKSLTSDMQNSLYNSLDNMKNYDYSLHNIEIVKREFIGKMLENINESILNLFAKLSAENTWYVGSENIHYYNGWKSNKAHKVNKKVIIPMNGAFAEKWYHQLLNTYNITGIITDIEKVFNYLNGEAYSYADPAQVIERANINCQSRNIQFKYFSITLYKKGTCHIKFTNTDVLDALNIYVGRQKNWLPPSYGKVAYDDMSSEDKQVIDEFQGKEEYAKVFANPSKYIFETSQMLALTDGGNK